MKKAAYIFGILLIAVTFSFLYAGNVITSFNTTTVSKVLGVLFEVALLGSSILMLLIFFKHTERLYFTLALIPVFLFLVHYLFILTMGFQKAYSYAMDVVIIVLYGIIILRKQDFLLGKNGK